VHTRRCMQSSLAIGDFSRATHLTVKTLHHYHETGLLEPAQIDTLTGYRRYTTEQIPVAQIIKRFRDLDMPLSEIREVLSAPDVQARNDLIAAHLKRLENELARTQTAVASLRNLLEHPAPTLHIGRRRAEQVAASLHASYPRLSSLPSCIRGRTPISMLLTVHWQPTSRSMPLPSKVRCASTTWWDRWKLPIPAPGGPRSDGPYFKRAECLVNHCSTDREMRAMARRPKQRRKLFYVLNLLAHLLYEHFHVHSGARGFNVLRF
jgi:DNA-binding transcriptional MerR regulator